MSPGTCGPPSTTARCCHSGDLRLAHISRTSDPVVLPQCETSIHWSCPELDVHPWPGGPLLTGWQWAPVHPKVHPFIPDVRRYQHLGDMMSLGAVNGAVTLQTLNLHSKCAQVPAPGGHDVAGGGERRGHAQTLNLHSECVQVPAPGGHDVAGGGEWRGHAAAAAAAAAGGCAAGWDPGQPGGRSRREGGLCRRLPAHHPRRCDAILQEYLLQGSESPRYNLNKTIRICNDNIAAQPCSCRFYRAIEFLPPLLVHLTKVLPK
jgi:hypothetical protein